MKKIKTRRQFVRKGIQASALLPFLGSALISCSTSTEDKKEKNNTLTRKLNILILGGTSFLGPHQIAYAISRGHSISTFTRGKSIPTVYPELFKKVESLIGDRENDLEALKNRKWDAVIDNSGRNVEWTKATAELLKDSCGLYLYTSSTGVYYPYLGDDIKEETKLLTEEPAPEELESEDEKMEYWYGVMKTNSEIAAQNAFGKDRTIIVRPTYMVGPADKLDRFIHWPIRFGQGGEILVPGKKEDPIQFIDVRDVAEFMIRLLEEKNINTFNAVGPKEKMGMHEFVKQAGAPFKKEHSFVYADDYNFLKENKVFYIVPWIPVEGKNKGSALVNNKKSIAAGLTYRPLDQTMLDTHAWWNGLPEERRQKFEGQKDSVFGREKEIIAAWKARK